MRKKQLLQVGLLHSSLGVFFLNAASHRHWSTYHPFANTNSKYSGIPQLLQLDDARATRPAVKPEPKKQLHRAWKASPIFGREFLGGNDHFGVNRVNKRPGNQENASIFVEPQKLENQDSCYSASGFTGAASMQT